MKLNSNATARQLYMLINLVCICSCFNYVCMHSPVQSNQSSPDCSYYSSPGMHVQLPNRMSYNREDSNYISST